MKVEAYAKSVVGATHIRKNPKNPECQDFCSTRGIAPNVTAIAIADGHGSSDCPYSADGAHRAANAYIQEMANIFSELPKTDERKSILSELMNDSQAVFAKRIEARWRKTVIREHYKKRREKSVTDSDTIEGKKSSVSKINAILDNGCPVDFMKYGTTLLGITIADDFASIYQIGDGDIQLINEDGVKPLVEGDHFLGVETYSMAHDASWNYAKTTTVSLADIKKPFLIMLSTDGLSNSYVNSKEFATCCNDYFEIIRDEGFATVEKELAGWLRDTSDNGCGDDITVALAYCSDEE